MGGEAKKKTKTKTPCRWEGKQVNCSEIFTPVITDTGVCCAFNLQSDLRESEYSHLVEEMQVKKFKVFLFFFRVMRGHLKETGWLNMRDRRMGGP